MRAFISNRIMKLCNNALNALGVGGPTQGVLILVSLRCGCVRLDDPIGYWLFFAPHYKSVFANCSVQLMKGCALNFVSGDTEILSFFLQVLVLFRFQSPNVGFFRFILME